MQKPFETGLDTHTHTQGMGICLNICARFCKGTLASSAACMLLLPMALDKLSCQKTKEHFSVWKHLLEMIHLVTLYIIISAMVGSFIFNVQLQVSCSNNSPKRCMREKQPNRPHHVDESFVHIVEHNGLIGQVRSNIFRATEDVLQVPVLHSTREHKLICKPEKQKPSQSGRIRNGAT